MKKIYNSIKLCLALVLLGVTDLGAQALNGAYTINSGMSTSGTNFASFNAFASALNTNGVSGPVVVNVAVNSGPYNEQVAFTQIQGMSAVNRVTINGNNNLLTYNSSSGAPHTMLLNGTDYLTVNELQMSGTNGTYALVCILTNGANFNTFSACTFSCPFNGTSSYQVPFAFSSSATSLSSGGNPGNNNSVLTSTLYSGYYSIFHYGLTSAPYTSDNSFIGCYITDFYYYMCYANYAKNFTIKNCTIDRLTRTNFTTTYFFYGMYMQGFLFDGNVVHKLYDANQSYTGTFYGFYYMGYCNPSQGQNRNTFRNNIIKDINFNGPLYMFMYNYYGDNDYFNNTISLDQVGASASSVTYVWYYAYGGSCSGSNSVNNWKNNIVSITRGGSGQKYVVYMGGTTTGTNFDYNNFYVNSAGGGNNVGYYSSIATTFAQWQAQGPDVNGYSLDPQFANIAAGDVHPTNSALNNKGFPLGIVYDQEGAVRNPVTPDIGALEFLTPLCNGTPTNSISGPTYSLCPGESAYFSINNLSSDLGITYAWQTSTVSMVGPWTPIVNANAPLYTSPGLNNQVWYSVVITCTAPGGGSVQPTYQVDIAGSTTNTVKYIEDFENIGMPNRLPNCSWLAPNIGGSQKTFMSAQSGNRLAKSGSGFATFENNSPGNFYYTNGIWMEPGITYSASLWYQTDLTGATNWSDLSIMIGSAQSPGGLQTIASTNGPAVSPVYKALANTFVVPGAGLYYVAIKANAASSGATYLSWDDLVIEIPCTPTVNAVPLTLSTPAATVCSGAPVLLTAGGANTYTWNTGATGAVLSQSPVVNPTPYTVIGTNTLTGCTATKSQLIYLKPSPAISVGAYPPVSCAGTPVILSAAISTGGGNFSWNTGGTGANITVNPTGNTSYTVIGTNSQNCATNAVVNVVVNPNPNVSAQAPQQICVGEWATMIGAGAVTYNWSANTGLITTNPAIVSPAMGSIAYTLTGTDNNGCQGTAQVNLVVDACTGLNKISGSATGVQVYPNPTSGELTIDMQNGAITNLQVIDLTGRVLMNTGTIAGKTGLNLSHFAPGVYYIHAESGNNSEMIRIIKN